MTVSARTILKVLSLTAAFFVLLVVAYTTRRELVWIGTAFFLAVALNPAVAYFAVLFRGSRLAATSTVFVLMFGVLVFMGFTLVPPLVHQSEQLVASVPGYTNQLANGDSALSNQLRNFGLASSLRISQAELAHYATGAGGSVFKIFIGIFSSFAAGITILGLTFFMLLEGPGWVELFWKTVPEREREHNRRLAGEMYEAVTGYVTGNIFTSLLAAVLVAAMLTLVRVPYAVPLGMLVGLFDLIPLVGATLGAIVVILAALFTSVTAAVVMLIFFLVYQQLENHILQPIIYGRTVRMSPLTVLVSVLIGAGLGGLVGALVAIPVGASLQIVIKDTAAGRAAGGRAAKPRLAR